MIPVQMQPKQKRKNANSYKVNYFYISVFSTMDRQRIVLVDALCRKGIALCRLYLMQQLSSDAENTVELETISNVWLNLLKFIDVNDPKVSLTSPPVS